MADNGDGYQTPLESPTGDANQRPKRRKIETEKVRAAREMSELEAGADEMDVEPSTRADPTPGIRPDGVQGSGSVHRERTDREEPQAEDKEDAPYQPPEPGTVDAEGEDEELQDIFDHYQSDKPLKHSLQGTFLKDLYAMMIGFGDDESPSMETVEFVEDALVSYSVDILKSALDLSKQRGRRRSTGKPTGPPTAEDVVTVVRKDARKVKRIEELLIMQQEIKVAQDTIEKQVRGMVSLHWLATSLALRPRWTHCTHLRVLSSLSAGGSRDVGTRAREYLVYIYWYQSYCARRPWALLSTSSACNLSR